MTIDIKSMGYIRVSSTDLEAWKSFAEKVLGLGTGRGPVCRLGSSSSPATRMS